MLTAVSIAFKIVIVTFVQPLTRSLGIPGGAPVGGLYMFWLPLTIALTKKRGSAFLICLIQALVLLITGMPGSHGVWNFFTYLFPGITVEIVFLIKTKKPYNVLLFMLATALANIAGVYGSNLLFFNLSAIPLIFTLLVSALSGAIGGIIGYATYKKTEATGLLNRLKPENLTTPPADNITGENNINIYNKDNNDKN